MKTTVETVDDVTVKLTVEVEADRIKKAMDTAAREIGKQVQIPGFRKGKVPRRVLEQKFGAETIRSQALDDSLGQFYMEALQAEDIVPVAQPELDLKAFDEKEGCQFEATVEVVPTFDLGDHTGIKVTYPEWDVADEDVDAQIERLRDQFATTEPVERAAAEGDYVTIDLSVAIDGEVLEDATVEDALYELGSGGVTPKLDEELPGSSAGDEVVYTDTLPEDYPEHGGKEATFTVTVKEVQERKVPDLDDDFAAEASEFETMEELRKSLRDGLLRRSVAEAQGEFRNRVVEAFIATAEVTLPPSMVTEERERRQELLELQATQMGMSVEDVLAEEDMTLEDWESEQETASSETVKATLVLDKLAKELELEVTPQDLDREIHVQSQRYNLPPQRVVEILQENGSIQTLVQDAMRRKTIDALADAADVDGAPSDEVLIELGLKADPDALTMEEQIAKAVEIAQETGELPDFEGAVESATEPVDESEAADEEE